MKRIFGSTLLSAAASMAMAILLSSCRSVAPEHVVTERDYHIFSAATSKEISLSDIVNAAGSSDVVVFGEEHNDQVGHYLERALLEQMHTAYGANVALSMEMFERDVQPVVDEYLQGFVRDRELVRDGRAWQNYKDYRPCVDFAKSKKLDVIAANSPGRYASLATRRGMLVLDSLSPIAKSMMAPLPIDTATGDYYKRLTDASIHEPTAAPKPAPKTDTAATKSNGRSATITARVGMGTADSAQAVKPAMPAMPAMPAFNIVYGQSVWDATMAHSIAVYHATHPAKKILQLNGKFHSDQRFGVVQQLAKYDPTCRVLVISCTSDSSFAHPVLDSLRRNGDFIILTDPSLPRTYGE